jgi:hypothetical protein
VTVRRAGQHVGQSPCQCVVPEEILIQLFPSDDKRLSLETENQFPPDQHVGQSPCQCVIPEEVLIQLFPPDDERLSLETCIGRKLNTLKKWKKCVKLVVNPELPQDARSTKYKREYTCFLKNESLLSLISKQRAFKPILGIGN